METVLYVPAVDLGLGVYPAELQVGLFLRDLLCRQAVRGWDQPERHILLRYRYHVEETHGERSILARYSVYEYLRVREHAIDLPPVLDEFEEVTQRDTKRVPVLYRVRTRRRLDDETAGLPFDVPGARGAQTLEPLATAFLCHSDSNL